MKPLITSYSAGIVKYTKYIVPSMLIDFMSRLLPSFGLMKKAPPFPVEILISKLSKLDFPKLFAMLSSDMSYIVLMLENIYTSIVKWQVTSGASSVSLSQ